MDSERERRNTLTDEMSSLVSRLGIAAGLTESKFTENVNEEIDWGDNKINTSELSLQTTTTTTKKNYISDATRFLRSTNAKQMGVAKRDVGIQAFTSLLRFEHTLSRQYGGMSTFMYCYFIYLFSDVFTLWSTSPLSYIDRYLCQKNWLLFISIDELTNECVTLNYSIHTFS
jgi:hypothetical protein